MHLGKRRSVAIYRRRRGFFLALSLLGLSAAPALADGNPPASGFNYGTNPGPGPNWFPSWQGGSVVPYLQFDGGGTIGQTINTPSVTPFGTFPNNLGFTGGGTASVTLGLDRAPLWGGLQWEGFYNGVNSSNGSSANGQRITNALMVNGFYDFFIDGPVSTYVGAGVGGANVNLRFGTGGSPDFEKDNRGFAYQTTIGATYSIAPGIRLDANVTRFAVPSLDVGEGSGSSLHAGFSDYAFNVGAIIALQPQAGEQPVWYNTPVSLAGFSIGTESVGSTGGDELHIGGHIKGFGCFDTGPSGAQFIRAGYTGIFGDYRVPGTNVTLPGLVVQPSIAIGEPFSGFDSVPGMTSKGWAVSFTSNDSSPIVVPKLAVTIDPFGTGTDLGVEGGVFLTDKKYGYDLSKGFMFYTNQVTQFQAQPTAGVVVDQSLPWLGLRGYFSADYEFSGSRVMTYDTPAARISVNSGGGAVITGGLRYSF